MTTEEFQQLIDKAESRLGTRLEISRCSNGDWQVDNFVPSNCVYAATFNEMVEHIRGLANPPKPETVTITIPFEAAVWAASVRKNITQRESIQISEACERVVARWADTAQ